MAFVKLFGSILESTIWDESPEVRVVWITLLAMANSRGEVESSIPGLVNRSRVDRAHVDRALAVLMAPDPDSRTKEHEGRRIEPIDGGWKILNHAKYRMKMSADERRERDAERKRAKRREMRASADSPQSSAKILNVAHTDAEAESYAEAERESLRSPARAKTASQRQENIPGRARESSESTAKSRFRLQDDQSTVRDGGSPHAGVQPPLRASCDWTPEDQQRVFVSAFEAAQGTYPTMGGKQVGAFHAKVVRTAELQQRDPRELFTNALRKWLAKGLDKLERKAPYACFDASWGELTARAEDPDFPEHLRLRRRGEERE